jgi:hypothetical protein
MDFKNKYVDELIELRKEAREQKDWLLSDSIRDYLDAQYIFIVDGVDGQIVYHRSHGTRLDLIKELNAEARAEKMFDAWYLSMRASYPFDRPRP